MQRPWCQITSGFARCSHRLISDCVYYRHSVTVWYGINIPPPLSRVPRPSVVSIIQRGGLCSPFYALPSFAPKRSMLSLHIFWFESSIVSHRGRRRRGWSLRCILLGGFPRGRGYFLAPLAHPAIKPRGEDNQQQHYPCYCEQHGGDYTDATPSIRRLGRRGGRRSARCARCW